MRASWEQLHHLPVYTKSDEKVGMVEGVTVQTDGHVIERYEIKPSALLARIFSKSILIAPNQVISITAEKMVVEDAAIPAEAEAVKKQMRLASVGAVNPEVHPSEQESV